MKGSQRAYAKHRKALGLIGGSLGAVQKALASGRIVIEPDGQLDFEKCDRMWLENTGQMKQREVPVAEGPGLPPVESLSGTVPAAPAFPQSIPQQPPLDLGPSKVDLEKQLLTEKASALRRENERREGMLVPVEEIEQEVGELQMAAHGRLRAIPAEVRDQLAVTRDPAEVQSILTKHIDTALEELAKYRVRGAAAAAVILLVARLAQLWAPPSTISVSQWAEGHRYLSSEVSARSGKWHSFAFQREPMDVFSDPAIRRCVIKSSTQLLKSSTAENVIGYAMDVTPGPILGLLPRKEDAFEFSEDRIAPMIEATPRLRAIAKVSRSGRAPKRYRGGRLTLTSGGSPANVAKRAIMLLVVDEADKLPPSAGEEGGPVALARKRLVTYGNRAKELIASSPTIEGSLIDREYSLSDQREFYVPCPHCGVLQSLMKKWDRVRCEETRTLDTGEIVPLTRQEQADSARYYCEAPECQKPWDNTERLAAVDQGVWKAHASFNGIAGFWINELYSPFKSLSQMVMDYFEKREYPEDYKSFVNTSLAENWVAQGESPQYELLLARREEYPVGVIPRGGLVITGAADVQEDRIEVELVAWGRRLESWSFFYDILPGDTSELSGRAGSPSPWQKLTAILAEFYPHAAGGDFGVNLFFVDSGYRTNTVYTWVRQGQPVPVMATKGVEKGHRPVSQPTAVDVTIGGRLVKSGMKVRTINTSFFKEELYSWLKKAPPSLKDLANGFTYPQGYCHIPKDDRRYDEEYVKQLCAEQLVSIRDKRRGYVRQEWQKIRPRNEALDLKVLNRAAAWELGIDRYREHHWKELEGRLGAQQPEFALIPQSNHSPVAGASVAESSPSLSAVQPSARPFPAHLAARSLPLPVSRPIRGRFL